MLKSSTCQFACMAAKVLIPRIMSRKHANSVVKTAAIRQREKGAHRTWIIAMTANAISGDREQCLAAGMDDYVSKPVRIADLADALDRARSQIATQMEENAIDPEALSELEALPGESGENLLTSLIQLFMSEAPQTMAEIHAALDASDARAVAMAAHQLKGCCGQFGAHRLQSLCAQLEKIGRTGSLQSIGDLLAWTERELQRVISSLEPKLSLSL